MGLVSHHTNNHHTGPGFEGPSKNNSSFELGERDWFKIKRGGGSIPKINVGGKIPEMGSGQRIVNSDHSPGKKEDKMVSVPIFCFF